jgi:hypothetical protein
LELVERERVSHTKYVEPEPIDQMQCKELMHSGTSVGSKLKVTGTEPLLKLDMSKQSIKATALSTMIEKGI